MFITTESNPTVLDTARREMTFPGPRVLIASAEAGLARDLVASAEAHYLIVMLVTAPTSSFDALRIALTRIIRARIDLKGPLLFTVKGCPDKEVERATKKARRDPWLIEYIVDPTDGELSTLVLGEAVVANPLSKTFFCNLHEGVTQEQTGGCIALMEEHLVWHKEGRA